MKYNEQDMAQLISEVETEFKEYLAKAEESVTTDEKTLEASVSEDVTNEGSLEKSETSKEFDYDENDIKEMNDMYSSMTKSEKEAHYSAIKSVMFSKSEEESEDLNKSEEEVKDEEKVLLKSELENSKKETEELKKNIETLTSIVSKIVKKAPSRKAVTQIGNIQVMKKSEEPIKEEEEIDYTSLNKSEINKILTGKIRNGEIKKAEDKEKINQFCYGQVKIDEIKHLLGK